MAKSPARFVAKSKTDPIRSQYKCYARRDERESEQEERLVPSFDHDERHEQAREADESSPRKAQDQNGDARKYHKREEWTSAAQRSVRAEEKDKQRNEEDLEQRKAVGLEDEPFVPHDTLGPKH
jgi:hypothetical protein